MFVFGDSYIHTPACLEVTEQLAEVGFLFYCVGLGKPTRVVRLWQQALYPLSHLPGSPVL